VISFAYSLIRVLVSTAVSAVEFVVVDSEEAFIWMIQYVSCSVVLVFSVMLAVL
jgi:hypothetical protein